MKPCASPSLMLPGHSFLPPLYFSYIAPATQAVLRVRIYNESIYKQTQPVKLKGTSINNRDLMEFNTL